MDLLAALRQSIDEANDRTRGIFGGANAMSAREVADFLNASHMALVSTVSPSGEPHITGVGLVFLDNKLYLGLGKGTALVRNLRHNPSVAVAVVEPPWKRHVLVQGAVRILPDGGDELRRVHAAEQAKLGWASPIVAEVAPRKVFTWKD
jgi:nitroimidazol reductase NimA-like FMN-containing flavoprotein (pyridoxamine 5'-phosphate oxidase superfamily)